MKLMTTKQYCNNQQPEDELKVWFHGSAHVEVVTFHSVVYETIKSELMIFAGFSH